MCVLLMTTLESEITNKDTEVSNYHYLLLINIIVFNVFQTILELVKTFNNKY